MTFSHADCTHPATGRDRAICRKASNNSGPQAQAFPGGSRPSTNEAAQAFRDRIKANRRVKLGTPSETLWVTADNKLTADPDHDDTTRATARRVAASTGMTHLTIAEMKARQATMTETNPGCTHGLRFAAHGCAAC